MKYRKFIIQNYRAITGPLEIDVDKNCLVPIIGINESGKTTILQAIFAFDLFNDELNAGRHLSDTSNLYRMSSRPATIAAEIFITPEEFNWALDDVLGDGEKDSAIVNSVTQLKLKLSTLPNSITLIRHLDTGNYTLKEEQFSIKAIEDKLVQAIIKFLPYCLYFDDFRDSVEDRIEVIKSEAGEITGWLAIVEQLFKQTDETFSVFHLANLEERKRKSVLAKVKRHLNNTLTKEWQKFRLDETDALSISIEYEEELVYKLDAVTASVQPTKQPSTPTALSQSGSVSNLISTPPVIEPPKPSKRSFLKFEIIETDSNGDEHYFYIRDRSKGFFWFFNFVMKLEFNPKVLDEHSNTIYLLDEPGSYLHASAQSKLCMKLRQLSEKNRVLYCTHSHYLLDPAVIPLNSIRVADKDGLGDIRLIPIYEHQDNILDRRSAFQPVIDALQIKPFLLDLTQSNVIITEGIYDYYALEMFKGSYEVNILPSVGADSIPFYISLMIAWRVSYSALWDNDDAGRKALEKARQYFGDEVAQKHFYLLPLQGAKSKNRILQDLFVGADLKEIKSALGLPNNSSFQKTIATLFYYDNRTGVLNNVSQQTKQKFQELFNRLGNS